MILSHPKIKFKVRIPIASILGQWLTPWLGSRALCFVWCYIYWPSIPCTAYHKCRSVAHTLTWIARPMFCMVLKNIGLVSLGATRPVNPKLLDLACLFAYVLIGVKYIDLVSLRSLQVSLWALTTMVLLSSAPINRPVNLKWLDLVMRPMFCMGLWG